MTFGNLVLMLISVEGWIIYNWKKNRPKKKIIQRPRQWQINQFVNKNLKNVNPYTCA